MNAWCGDRTHAVLELYWIHLPGWASATALCWISCHTHFNFCPILSQSLWGHLQISGPDSRSRILPQFPIHVYIYMTVPGPPKQISWSYSHTMKCYPFISIEFYCLCNNIALNWDKKRLEFNSVFSFLFWLPFILGTVEIWWIKNKG